MSTQLRGISTSFLVIAIFFTASSILYVLEDSEKWFFRVVLAVISYGFWYIGKVLQQK